MTSDTTTAAERRANSMARQATYEQAEAALLAQVDQHPREAIKGFVDALRKLEYVPVDPRGVAEVICDHQCARGDYGGCSPELELAFTQYEAWATDVLQWFHRKDEGAAVVELLDRLPVGAEFRLANQGAYSALYRKNDQGLWDQQEGTTAAPHVVNMSADHLGFCVGLTAVQKALVANDA